jgi:hypothetical protein
VADDAIFDGQPNQPQGQQRQAASADDIQRALVGGFQQAVAPIRQELAEVKQQLAEARRPPDPPKPGNTDLDRLVEKPVETMRAEAIAAWRPVVEPMAVAIREEAVTREKARAIARYGEKGYRDYIEPRFNSFCENMQKENPVALVNPTNVRHLMSAAIGDSAIADDLERERREVASKALKESQDRERPPQFVGGPGRMVYTKADDVEVTSEDREFFDKLGRAGVKGFGEAEYRAARTQPRDMEERFQREMKERGVAQRPPVGGRR